MLEALLLTACLSTKDACSPAARAYYAHTPPIRQYVKKTQVRAVKYAGEWVLYAVPALALAQSRGVAQIRINRTFSLRFQPGQTTLDISAEF